MEKSLAKIELEDVSKEIDLIVESCMPAAMSEVQGFSVALAMANGVERLRDILNNNADIKKCITSMQDTRLGFLTDHSPAAIAYAKKNGKEMRPYPYNVIAEASIEAMLNGYRLTNNEFNIIAGNFYPAKNGKYRRIIENGGVSNFQYTSTTPIYEGDYAKVQCFSSWTQGDKLVKLGYSDNGIEDKLIFKVKVNRSMGEDAIVGKALSKLFSRVLSRIEGSIIPEATDVIDGEMTLIEGPTSAKEELPVGKVTLEIQPDPIPEQEKVEKASPPSELEKGEPVTDGQKQKLAAKMKKAGLSDKEQKEFYDYTGCNTKATASIFIDNFAAKLEEWQSQPEPPEMIICPQTLNTEPKENCDVCDDKATCDLWVKE